VPITGDRVVLTDEVVRRLVRAATDIKRVFGSRDQDIEWAYMKARSILCSRGPSSREVKRTPPWSAAAWRALVLTRRDRYKGRQAAALQGAPKLRKFDNPNPTRV
jgi:hypothetical protein